MRQFFQLSHVKKHVLLSALATSMALAPATWAREANIKLTAPTSTVATHNYDYEINVFHPVEATNGMVATEQNLASQIGLDILKKAVMLSMRPSRLDFLWR